MPQPQLGKIELINVREIWKHEERDFTPWLAQHIDQLSTLLEISIVVDQVEQKVGGYELDIRGHIGESEAVVIIENQLYPTDHGHLGQLIAYASGLDAKVVIWISPEIRDEHRSAVKWLNSHMDGKVSFFLVRPEVFRIDGSNPAIRFHLEVGPSEFDRRLKSLVENEDAPRHEFRRKFWEGMLQYLASNGHPWAKGRNTTKENWVNTSVGKSGVGVNVSMAQGSRIRVEIYCSNDPEKLLFGKLLEHKAEIEQRVPDETVSWERLEEGSASRVAVYRPYDKAQATDDTPYRRDLYAWISKSLITFRDIARKLLVDK